jgi:hypothetical protein
MLKEMLRENLNTGSTMSVAQELKPTLNSANISTIPPTVAEIWKISKFGALIMPSHLRIDCTKRNLMEMVFPGSFKQNQMGNGNLYVIIM